ncbi:MAG: UPF0016 family membrane protein [Sphingomonas sp. 28-62-20]|uniref:TMEM165/GDT1 family protein n=1 Tax=Sphingomonas sp. 28-62-20 TaxID=1970433 RepID=UPI000BCCB2C2|nr:MAG: UPF0016 family membrane protein [Sphingomonas sp. 28-62-20]
MDALMAAFVAALLVQAGDRTPWLAAILADRFQRPGQVIAAAILALTITNILGAIAGALMAPILTPNARALLVAFALVSAGVTALGTLKHPGEMAGWRTGAFLTSLIGLAALGVGDRTQFVTAALAAGGTPPAFAAVGATLGSLVVVIPALLAGAAARQALPLAAIRIGTGAVLIVAGIGAGLSALRLI